jgi:hypothetical protein
MTHYKIKYLTLILLVFSIGFISYSIKGNKEKYEEIKKGNLARAFIGNSSPTFKGYFYMGSDNSFHYFQSRWDFQKDKYFKIAVNSLKVISPFDYKKDGKELKIDLFKDKNQEFGYNEYYRLYIQK